MFQDPPSTLSWGHRADLNFSMEGRWYMNILCKGYLVLNGRNRPEPWGSWYCLRVGVL